MLQKHVSLYMGIALNIDDPLQLLNEVKRPSLPGCEPEKLAGSSP